MSRERCFHCWNELAFVPGKGIVYAEYIDPIGNKHKMHKECFKNGGYAQKTATASPIGENLGDGEYRNDHSRGL